MKVGKGPPWGQRCYLHNYHPGEETEKPRVLGGGERLPTSKKLLPHYGDGEGESKGGSGEKDAANHVTDGHVSISS